MSTISPEQAAFLLQYQLPSVKNEYRATSAVIAAIPTGNAEYRPDPQSKTAAELAWHIAAAEQRFYSGIICRRLRLQRDPAARGRHHAREYLQVVRSLVRQKF